jgi:hypothetical protein
MKKIVILLVALSLQSCLFPFGHGDDGEPPSSYYKAIYMDRDAFEASVSIEKSNSIDKVGKIYVYQNYLFINEKNKGFHVYDNTDPSNPTAIKYIKTPGATDMAIKNDAIYINQARDLIAIKLSSGFQSLTVTKRVQNIFPEMLSPDGFSARTPEGKVLINWVPK